MEDGSGVNDFLLFSFGLFNEASFVGSRRDSKRQPTAWTAATPTTKMPFGRFTGSSLR